MEHIIWFSFMAFYFQFPTLPNTIPIDSGANSLSWHGRARRHFYHSHLTPANSFYAFYSSQMDDNLKFSNTFLFVGNISCDISRMVYFSYTFYKLIIVLTHLKYAFSKMELFRFLYIIIISFSLMSLRTLEYVFFCNGSCSNNDHFFYCTLTH